MNLSIDIQRDAKYLVCTISGKWVTEDLIRFMDTISAKIKERGCRRMLADLSLVSGPPSEIDRYDVGKHFAAAFPGIKTAVVYLKVFDNNFFEDTAVNRGGWVQIFPDREVAIKWLMKGYTGRPNEAGEMH